MPNSIPMTWLYILTTCIWVSDSFSFLVAWCRPFTLGVKFFMRFMNCLSPVHFLSMWLSRINAITNSNGDRESPWKIPLWIFHFSWAFSSYFQFESPFFYNTFYKLHDFAGYLVHYESIIQLFRSISYRCIVNPRYSKVFPSRLALIEDVLIYVE